MPTRRRSVYADRLDRDFPDLALADERAFARRGRWRDFFAGRIGPAFDGQVVFEVGCHDAEFLARVAAKHPRSAFVGLDWKCRAVYDGAARVTAAGLPNVAFVNGRAQDVRQILADGEVDEVWVFHPDPCDRPTELQNRLIAGPFLADVHAVLRSPKSVLALKTDHPGYYQWVLALFGLPEPSWFREPAERSPRVRPRDLMRPGDLPGPSDAVRRLFDVSVNAPDYWNDPAAQHGTAQRKFHGETTAFERRFVRKRFPIYYVELRKR